MTAIRYRFQVTSLDGVTDLPADDAIEVVADGGFAQFNVKPVGSATFATLGLIPLARLQAKRIGRSTGLDGMRVQAVTLYDDTGPNAFDVDVDLAELAGTITTPQALESAVTFAVLDSVRRSLPGWPIFGSTSRLRAAEAGAATSFWQLIVVVQELPELACCQEGTVPGAPPPPP